MTAKGHISKTLGFWYRQVDINVKSDGRAIDRHAGRVSFVIMGDTLAGCRICMRVRVHMHTHVHTHICTRTTHIRALCW